MSLWTRARALLAVTALSLPLAAACGSQETAPTEAAAGQAATLTGSLAQQRTFTLEGGAIGAMAWHPTLPWIALGGQDGTVRVVDLDGGREVPMKQSHDEWVTEVAWTPGGRYVVSGSTDNTVRLWDVTTRSVVRTLSGHSGDVKALAVSADGTRIASGGVDRRVILWKTEDGEALETYRGYRNSVYTLAFHPNDESIVFVGGRESTIHLWDTEARERLDRLSDHTNSVFDLRFTPDGAHMVSTGADGRLLVWNTEDWTSRQLYQGDYMADAIAIDRQGQRVAMGDRKGEVNIYDRATGTLERMVPVGKAMIQSLDFSPDGKRLAAATDDGKLVMIDVEAVDGGAPAPIAAFTGFAASLDEVAVGAGGQVVAGLGGGDVTVWDGRTGAVRARVAAQGARFETLALSRDGETLAVGVDSGEVRLYGSADGALRKTHAGIGQSVAALGFSPDGRTIFVGGGWGKLAALDVESGAEGAAFDGHDEGLTAISVYPDGSRILTSSRDEHTRCWDVQTGKSLWALYGDVPRSNAVSGDGQRVAVGDQKGIIRLYEGDTGKRVGEMAGHRRAVVGLAFAPGDERLVSAGWDRSVKLWSVPDQAIITSTLPHRGWLASLAATPDGGTLVTGGRGGAGPAVLFEVRDKADEGLPEDDGAVVAANDVPGLTLPKLEGLPEDVEVVRTKTNEERAEEILASIRDLSAKGDKDAACDQALSVTRLVDNVDPYRRELTEVCADAATAHATPEGFGKCLKFSQIALELTPRHKPLEALVTRCTLMRLDGRLDELAKALADAPNEEKSLRHYNWRTLIAGGLEIEKRVHQHDKDLKVEGSREKLARGYAYLALGSYHLSSFSGENREELLGKATRYSREADQLAGSDPVVDAVLWTLTKERYMPMWIYGGALGGLALLGIGVAILMGRRRARKMALLAEDDTDAAA